MHPYHVENTSKNPHPALARWGIGLSGTAIGALHLVRAGREEIGRICGSASAGPTRTGRTGGGWLRVRLRGCRPFRGVACGCLAPRWRFWAATRSLGNTRTASRSVPGHARGTLCARWRRGSGKACRGRRLARSRPRTCRARPVRRLAHSRACQRKTTQRPRTGSDRPLGGSGCGIQDGRVQSSLGGGFCCGGGTQRGR